MSVLDELAASFRGWGAIVAGRADAARHFRTGARGVGIAAAALLVTMLLAVAAQSVGGGMPSAGEVLRGLAAQGLAVLLLAALTGWAQRLRGLALDRNALLVPMLHALAYMVLLGLLLALLAPNAALLAVLGLGALGYRAGRTVARLPAGRAAAFAGLSVIVLVVVPNALYMLLSLFSPA